ncbi:TPA: hypothetical protein RTK63_004373 [Vibrio harveyi]|nr:hypothetical protein [Vibrio harveyi]
MLNKKLIYCCFVLLSGCGNNNVDIVKSGRMDYDNSYTISDAFDTRKICEKTSWNETKDSLERDIVQYICFFNENEKFLDERLNFNISRLQNEFSSKLEQRKMDINNYKIKLKNHTSEIEHIKKVIDSHEKLIVKYESYDFNNDEKVIDLRNQLESELNGRNDEYIVSRFKEQIAQRLSYLNRKVETEIKHYENVVKTNNKSLIDYQNRMNSTKVELDSLIAQFDGYKSNLELEEKNAILKYKDTFSKGNPKVVEYFNWTVDKDGEFYLAESGLALERNGVIVKSSEYNDLSVMKVLDFIYEDPYKFNSFLDSKFYFEGASRIID